MNNKLAFEMALKISKEAEGWSKSARQRILETAYSQLAEGNVWKVIGITKKCFDALIENDFNYKAVKPVRAHLHQRRKIAFEVIEKNMNAEKAFEFMSERDVAYLALRSENKDDNSLTAFVSIDPNDGYFKATAMGYTYNKKREIPYLKELAKNYLD